MLQTSRCRRLPEKIGASSRPPKKWVDPRAQGPLPGEFFISARHQAVCVSMASRYSRTMEPALFLDGISEIRSGFVMPEPSRRTRAITAFAPVLHALLFSSIHCYLYPSSVRLLVSRTIIGPGRPGWLPTQVPHKSGLAHHAHPVPHLMNSRPEQFVVGTWTWFRSRCTCQVSLQRLMRRHPLPLTGCLGLVPPLHRYYEVLRLPAAHFAALRFLRLAIPSLRPLFVPPAPDAEPWINLELASVASGPDVPARATELLPFRERVQDGIGMPGAMAAVARPGILARVGHHRGPHWVCLDLPQNDVQVVAVLDDRGSEAALPDVAAGSLSPVVPPGVSDGQGLEDAADRLPGGRLEADENGWTSSSSRRAQRIPCLGAGEIAKEHIPFALGPGPPHLKSQ